ncbi:unnamed protein product [Rotaria sordida]|uniref:Uncharacterized protein n=1 Tax=Rotaria sordida TaxID=392033 RepID=A0A814XVJ3_9BILA|nr:unnamed protein product [Rotaria sordida]CAF1500694.1 unnamed protein product [Rotaria sordida]
MRLPINPDIVAPDGSLVRNLLTTIVGSMAQFDLPPDEFWRKQNEKEETVTVDANVCITIPVGTQFQFRTIRHKPFVAVAITMPPWPGHSEAMLRLGIWNASFIGIENSSTKLTNSIYRLFIIVIFLIINII